MPQVIVQFDTWLRNILYVPKGQVERKADSKSCSKKGVHNGMSCLCFPLGFMVFVWVYGFPLGLCLSFGYMVLVWVYVFCLGLCYSCVLSGLGIKLYWMNKERCALDKGPGRSWGGNISYSSPPPLSMVRGSWHGAHRDPGVTEMHLMTTGGTQGYSAKAKGLCDRGSRTEIQV